MVHGRDELKGSVEESWLVVMGRPELELSRSLTANVKERIARREFTWQQVRDIAHYPTMPQLDFESYDKNVALTLNRAELDQLRHLCRIWDIELRPERIESHRKFIGPFIVLGKKLFARVMRVLLKDLIKQQREFNAAVITLIAKLNSKSI